MTVAQTNAYSSPYSIGLASNLRSTSAIPTSALTNFKDGSSAASAGDPAVMISLTPQARAALAAQSDAIPSRYAPYFPTRDGASAASLANGVSAPGGVSSSAGKSFDLVASDARARMDAEYAAMQASGKPFEYNSFEGKDWYTLMGDLDRRSLYAVSSNAGGRFTKQEQDIAQSIMQQQQGLAMGLYSGPISQSGTFVDPFLGDHGAQAKAGVKFLDGVSNEEKTSVIWAMSRASAQTAYEINMEEDGKVPENLDTAHPLVKLIMAAMSTMKGNAERGTTHGNIATADDLRKQPWFEGFESMLDAAMEQTQSMYWSKRSLATA